ncbi:hypothetical protein Tco_0193241, partial [Tanacetum coccineum]
MPSSWVDQPVSKPSEVQIVEAPLALLLSSLDLPELESPSWVPFKRENRQISRFDNLYDLMILVNSGCGNRTDIHGCFYVVE